jgi:aspartyl-tRNA(Asn)/glutamyl-tRNA(Gln) amidotransferase subunit A
VPAFRDAARSGLKGVVIGRPKEYFPDDLDPRIRDRCDAALDHMRTLGADVRDVSLPHTKLAIEVYYIIAPAEASANLAESSKTVTNELERIFCQTEALRPKRQRHLR